MALGFPLYAPVAGYSLDCTEQIKENGFLDELQVIGHRYTMVKTTHIDEMRENDRAMHSMRRSRREFHPFLLLVR